MPVDQHPREPRVDDQAGRTANTASVNECVASGGQVNHAGAPPLSKAYDPPFTQMPDSYNKGRDHG